MDGIASQTLNIETSKMSWARVDLVNICLFPGQCSGPDSVRGLSANLRRATTWGHQRHPADQHQGSRVSQVKRGKPGSEWQQKPGGCRDGGRLTQRSEGGAMSHLLFAAPDVHCWSQHCQVGALSGRTVETVQMRAAAWVLVCNTQKRKETKSKCWYE